MSDVDIFLTLAGIVLIPWMGWVSLTLYAIAKNTSAVAERLADHERRISELEALAPRTIVVAPPPAATN